MVLIQSGDSLYVDEGKWHFAYVCKLSVVAEVHPTCMRLCHVQRLNRHVLKVQDLCVDDIA